MSHSYVGILDGWRPTLRGQPGQNYIVGTSQLPTLSFNVAVTNMPPRVLLLGGHGRVSLLLTSMLLSRSWSVTSVIRDPSQTEEILSKGKGQPGKVDVLVRSLEDIKSEEQAQSVLDEVKPQYVVWSAGTLLYLSSLP